MAQQLIYAAKAHVFQIDSVTRKQWLPLSRQAVDVSFYLHAEPDRRLYRIISYDEQKLIINSTIIPKMKFSKTSQKFGQWADTGAGTVYGLGFPSELDLSKFSEKFAEIKEIMEREQQSYRAADQQAGPQRPVNGTGNNNILEETSHSKVKQEQNSPMVVSSAPSLINTEQLQQVQEENRQLKRALEESASNASRWENELGALRKDNEDLKKVMHENSKNANEWMKRLNDYEKERVSLSARIAELERSDESDVLQRQLSDAMGQLELTQRNVQQKQEEVVDLKKKLDAQQMTIKQQQSFTQLDAENHRLKAQLQAADDEKIKMKGEIKQLTQQLEQLRDRSSSGRDQLHAIQQLIGGKINDLYEINDKLAEVISQDNA